MHPSNLRVAVRRLTAAAATVAVAVAGLLAVASPADAATTTVLGDPTAMQNDVAVRTAHLGAISPAPAVRIDDHVGGLATAVGLAAAGFAAGDTVDPIDIVKAAAEYGVDVSEPLRAVEVGRVRDAAWARAAYRMTLRGIDVTGSPDITDLAAVAEAHGIDPAAAADPARTEEILAAAHETIAEQLRAGGFPMGEWVDESDIRAAGRLYKVEVGKTLTAAHVRAVAERVAKIQDPESSPVYAKIGRVELHLPGFGPHFVGFHQSSSGVALKQKPVKHVRTDVLPSRSRGTASTGAVDVTLRPGDDVVAAVTGKVVEATEYSLYGKYEDIRIRIVPDDDPKLLVTMLHMEGRKVKVGDRVVGGQTVVADSARTFPFASQIDRFSGRHWGHVHVEARRR